MIASQCPGGFCAGSDHFYEISASVGYRWNTSIGTAVGYRMFDVNYEDEAVTCSFREGALEDDPRLNNLVRLLVKL